MGACRRVPRGEGAGCDCAAYWGVAPHDALAELLRVLPPDIAITRTARGYHLIFWAADPMADGTLTQFSADVFGGRTPHALQITPSLHPSGTSYTWFREPRADLPVVDLAEFGYVPQEAGHHGAVARSAGGSIRLAPAPPSRQVEFAALMGRLGLRRRAEDDEHHGCPWHLEDEGSLHVSWVAALFHCFGCGERGGLRRLRELVGPLQPPSCDPLRGAFPLPGRGLQLGGSAVTAERDRLAGALEEIGEPTRAGHMRECREYEWDALNSLEALACPNGDSTPLRVQTNSCDDPQCPMCMPWRLAADWRSRWERRGESPPDHLTLVALDAKTSSDGLADLAYLSRVRAQFREWRRARGIEGGFYGLVLRREGECWRARLLVGTSNTDAHKVTDGRAFAASVHGRDVDSPILIRTWQQAYLEEVTAWESLEELRAFRSMAHGRRKFQGWGDYFGGGQRDGQQQQKEEPDVSEKQPLHRMSGGSGRRAKRAPACPRCGDRLRRVGRFDPKRMEMVISGDGVPEWRWRQTRSDA